MRDILVFEFKIVHWAPAGVLRVMDASRSLEMLKCLGLCLCSRTKQTKASFRILQVHSLFFFSMNKQRTKDVRDILTFSVTCVEFSLFHLVENQFLCPFLKKNKKHGC